MSAASRPLLAVRDLVKDYRGLRPLRVRDLSVPPGALVTLTGVDAPAAEMLVHLLTGAALPDAGQVELFGRDTAAIEHSEAWLSLLEGVGLVGPRAVLVDAFSARQNVAMPLTLSVDPIDPAVAPRVDALVREVGLDEAAWDRPAGAIGPEATMRVHLARALVLGPSLLVAEHPTAAIPRERVDAFARDLARVVRERQLALLTLTADAAFARALGADVLSLDPATGVVSKAGWWKRLLQ